MARLAESSLGAGNGALGGVDGSVCLPYRASTVRRQSRMSAGSEQSPSEYQSDDRESRISHAFS
jgi:hypothetical protein